MYSRYCSHRCHCQVWANAEIRGGPVVVVSALYDASTLGANGATVVPVGIPGYEDQPENGEELVKKITTACEYHDTLQSGQDCMKAKEGGREF